MRFLRRVVFPVLWLVVFAVIAAALVKLAFFDGLKDQGEQMVPGASVQAPVIETVLGTVTNTVELAGAVQSDPAVPVRSTAAGKVVHFFVKEGVQVAAGDSLFQVRAELAPDPAAPLPDSPAPRPDSGDERAAPAAPPAPIYTYTDVFAPAAGTLETLTVLLNQEVSVGESAGTIAPGTFSITGSLTAAQQFRLVNKPATATGTVTGGPAPFACQNVQLSNKSSKPDNSQNPGTGMGGAQGDGGSGQVSCAVPADVTVFPGLGATITLTAGESQNVLTLPVTAVKGSVQNGLVWRPAGDGSGEPQEHKVVLGLNDGEKVEIVEGLAEGDQVLEFVPGVDAVLPDGPMVGFGRAGG